MAVAITLTLSRRLTLLARILRERALVGRSVAGKDEGVGECGEYSCCFQMQVQDVAHKKCFFLEFMFNSITQLLMVFGAAIRGGGDGGGRSNICRPFRSLTHSLTQLLMLHGWLKPSWSCDPRPCKRPEPFDRTAPWLLRHVETLIRRGHVLQSAVC